MMGHRIVEVIYCDDIRQEVSGKTSYIGVYHEELWVNEFPASLPKLCMAVKVIIPVDQPITSYKVRVLLDQSVAYETEYGSLPAFEGNPEFQAILDAGLDAFMSSTNNLVFSPITFERECTLRVRVITSDDEEIKGPALRVRQSPQNT